MQGANDVGHAVVQLRQPLTELVELGGNHCKLGLHSTPDLCWSGKDGEIQILADERSCALTCGCNPLLRQETQGTPHCPNCDIELSGDSRKRRKLFTWRVLPCGYRLEQCVSHLQIRRTLIVRRKFAHVSEASGCSRKPHAYAGMLTRLYMCPNVSHVAAFARDAQPAENPARCANTGRGSNSHRNPLGVEAMQVDSTRLYRVKAVAEMFDVSPATIYRAIAAGDLDALKVGKGKGALRIPGEAISVYKDQCGEAAYQSYVRQGDNPAADDDPGTDTAGYQPDPHRLTGAQVRGLACVACKADFVAADAPGSVPVGHADGVQLFACLGVCADQFRRLPGQVRAAMTARVSCAVTDQQTADLVLGHADTDTDAAGEVA